MKDYFVIQQKVMLDVIDERARQDMQWGPEHDDKHPTFEFVQLIQNYSNWAQVMSANGSEDKARRRLVQVAALAFAAVEAIDRRKSRKNP